MGRSTGASRFPEVLGMVLVLAACTTQSTSSAGGPASRATAAATTGTATGTGRPDTPAGCPTTPVVRGRRVRDGHIQFEVLAVTAPVRAIVGTHAEFEPRGEYVRVRLAVDNLDSTFHDVLSHGQRLLDRAGRTFEPSVDAMRIKRQPDDVNLGSGDRLEFDLWFDVPAGDQPALLLVRADGCGRRILLPPALP